MLRCKNYNFLDTRLPPLGILRQILICESIFPMVAAKWLKGESFDSPTLILKPKSSCQLSTKKKN